MNLEDTSVQDVIAYLDKYKQYVKPDQRKKIGEILMLQDYLDSTNHKEVETVDMLSEAQEQLKLVRKLRLEILASGNKTKDLKELVSTSNTLFATLTKYSGDMENQDKVKKLERATVTSLGILSKEQQEQFLNELEKNLSQ